MSAPTEKRTPPPQEQEPAPKRRESVNELSESQRVEMLAKAIKNILAEETPEDVAALPEVAWMDYNGNVQEDNDHLRNLFNAKRLMQFYIDRVVCAAGSRDGDNYMSVVKRVHVFKPGEQSPPNIEDTGAEGTTKAENTVIIKRLVPSASRRQLYRCIDAFINEVHSYRFLLPLLNQHSKQDLCPKCFLALKNDLSFHGDPIIVMEDLKNLGFRMQNRQNGLELKYCILVMQKLAQFHAAGMAAKLLKPSLYRKRTDCMREIVYNGEASAFYATILDTSIQQAIDSLTNSNVDGTLTETIRLIKRQRRRLYQHIQQIVLNASKSDLSVVCHGDLWVNNIMFVRSNESDEKSDPIKVIFYDLQAVRVTSAVFDILHFIYTSTCREMRDEHIRTLIAIYCDAISDCLLEVVTDRRLAAERDRLRKNFSFERVFKEYKHFIMYGLAIAMWVLPAVTFDPKNIPNLDQISESSPMQISVSKNLTEVYHKRIKETALEFCEKGYLQKYVAMYSDDDDYDDDDDDDDDDVDNVKEVDAAI